MSLITGPAEKRAAAKKTCKAWLYAPDPWPMADMKTYELLWLYGSPRLEPKAQADIEIEFIHRLVFKLLSPVEEKRVIQALEEKDQDIL